MAQISKQDFRALEQKVDMIQLNAARALAALNARVNELQRIVETQGLAINEALHLTPEQSKRFRERIDAVHAKIAFAGTFGAWCAEVGEARMAPGTGRTFADQGRSELLAHPPAELEVLEFYALVEPDAEARPRGVLARMLGRKAA